MGVPSSAADVREAVDLEELAGQTLLATTAAAVVLALAILSVAALGFNRVEFQLLAVIMSLFLAAGLAYGLAGHNRAAASVCLVAGLGGALVVAFATLPPALVAPWTTLVVLVAGALLGTAWGAVAASLVSLGFVAAAGVGWLSLGAEASMSAAGLAWAGLFVAWVVSRPTHAALSYAATSYARACAAVREVREHQAELARLSKSLTVSYQLMEHINQDLDRARRVAEEARRLKAEFAAAVSHELRTPLNLIIGLTEMMVLSPSAAYGRPLPRGYRDDLEAIYRNACHLSALVDDILDLSQVDADRMALHQDWADVPSIVAEAVAPVETLFRNRGLSLAVDLPDDLPAIFVDRTRIRQILINLLTNAARFTDEGGVTVAARREEESLVVTVTDTGPGISPEELPRVFDEFHQVGGLGRRRGGSGLGLAVSKRFAELHGGAMWAESAPGSGTTFALRLPLDDRTYAGATSPARRDGRTPAVLRGHAERRVLVVDEGEELPRLIERYLDGYRVLTVPALPPRGQRDLGEPLHAVVVGSPAARERWRSLSRSTPAWQAVPVIECPLRTTARMIGELGVGDYLVKPITRGQLKATLRRLGRDWQAALIVDDDPDMQRLLGRILRSIAPGSDVRVACDGCEALAVLDGWRPDLVFLDLLMPSIDGYGVLEALRADPTRRAIPVVVITARDSRREAIVAAEVRLTRDTGLTVAEVMRWLRGGLDGLAGQGTSDPVPRATPAA